MSTLTRGSVRCHRCHSRFDAQLWTGLHAGTAPEVRQAILDESFHRFDCPSCGTPVQVEPTLLYTDFDRYHWIAVLPDSAIRHRGALERLVEKGFRDNVEIHAPPMVQDWAPRFVRRAVFGLASLRDKLLALDAGLDDRVLELFKWQLLRDGPAPLLPDTRIWLDRVESDRLVFTRVEEQGAVGMDLVHRFAVPRRGYDALVAHRAAAPVGSPDLFAGIVVDWRAPLMPDLPLDDASPSEGVSP